MPSMTKSRIGHTSFKHGGYLYAFGGRQDSVERLSLEHKKANWELLDVAWPKTISKKFGFTFIMKNKLSSLSTENSVYIFGGSIVVHPLEFSLDTMTITEMTDYIFTDDIFYEPALPYDSGVVLNGANNLAFVNLEQNRAQQKERLVQKIIKRTRFPTP